MSDNECNHWNHKTSENGTHYCTDCLEILAVEPYWWGTITIGKMEQHFEKRVDNLDFGDLIEEHLGTNKINIARAAIVTDEENPWKQLYYIAFTAGSLLMHADIYAMRNERYIPTGLKFEIPAEVEAE